jgi:hypothetical protein
LVAALLLVTSAGAAVLIVRGEVGGEPTRSYGADAPEANSDYPLHYATRPVVLGVAPLSRGRRFELVGYQMRSRKGTSICLDIHVLPDGAAYGCGNDREHAQGTVSGPTNTLVDGATEPNIVRVEVRYRTAVGTGRARASLARVEGPVLAEARLRDPFGFYVAELPGGVVAAVTEALRRGRQATLGSDVPHPAGSPRWALTEPRASATSSAAASSRPRQGSRCA